MSAGRRVTGRLSYPDDLRAVVDKATCRDWRFVGAPRHEPPSQGGDAPLLP